jgi:hypothetical protein
VWPGSHRVTREAFSPTAEPVTGSDALCAEVTSDVSWGCPHGAHDTTPSEQPGLLGRLDQPALALPQRHAALDDVDDVLAAVALQQAGCDRGALAGTADDRDRLGRSMPLGMPWMSW